MPEIPEDGGQGKKLPADGRVRGPGTGRLRVGDWKIPVIALRSPVPKLLHRAEAKWHEQENPRPNYAVSLRANPRL